tara:strand:- start:1127 stop:1726 length:600 start_codon:yes stop_codon:yes gene_type:complete
MNSNFEYLDIILIAMIAGFIILRLRAILGKRTGHENKDYNDLFSKKIRKKVNEENIKNTDSKKLDDMARKQFIQGAKVAYETIVTSFARGDKKTLKPLLNQEIYQSFSDEIDKRDKGKEKSELTFVGLKSAEIQNFEKKDNIYTFTVNFVSEIITCKKDKDNKVIEGDPDEIKTVNDVWKFSKNMWSTNPNWFLVDTKV